jgi:hypothetical protein
MRTVLIALGLAALATPSLALTIQSAPNVDQQQHLRPAPAQQGLDIRDSYLGGGGGPTGLSYGNSARSNTDAPRFYYNSRDAWGRFNGVIPADDRFDTPRDRQTGYDPRQQYRRGR